MEVGDWITLVAVLVALGIGLVSILHTQSLQKKERKERLLNEIVEWVWYQQLNVKRSQQISTKCCWAGKINYEFISISLADEMLKAELIKLRATENAIPILNELDNVWQSAFFCAQLASRILGNTPTA